MKKELLDKGECLFNMEKEKKEAFDKYEERFSMRGFYGESV